MLAIPTKRYEQNTVSYLDLDEIKALSDAFTPPQYYRYVEHDTKLFDALISIGSLRAR